MFVYPLPFVQTEAGWTDIGAGQNFTQEDVEFNRLWYAHTTGTGFKGHDSIRFTLSDLDNESPPQSFFISVRTIQKGEDRTASWAQFYYYD